MLAAFLSGAIILAACSSSDDDQAPIDDYPGTPPTMLGNLTATVHSPYEIELFWLPSTDDGRVMGYDISRDGVLIEELVVASSYLDTMLEPATTYQYSVIAVDNDGNHGTPITVDVTTLDRPPPLPAITRENHVELLRHVFDIYTGKAYFSDIATLPDWSDPVYAGLPDDFSVETNVTCLNGGTARFTPFVSHLTGYKITITNLAWDFGFEGCQDNVVVLDGSLHREKVVTSIGVFYVDATVASSGLSLEGNSRWFRYAGSVSEHHDPSGNRRQAAGVSYSLNTGVSTFELSNANTRIDYNGDRMQGEFTVRSAATAYRQLHAEVLTSFRYDRSLGKMVMGELELTGDDGSKLELNVEDDEIDSATNIKITDSNGAIETFTQPWSLWEDNLRFELMFSSIWYSD
ncbi:MAG: fibronectin type III domain-containing protein [Rhodothermales bacterium]|nr:fibronectin type III domain-containing protein [Rhodothermales bacterium]